MLLGFLCCLGAGELGCGDQIAVKPKGDGDETGATSETGSAAGSGGGASETGEDASGASGGDSAEAPPEERYCQDDENYCTVNWIGSEDESGFAWGARDDSRLSEVRGFALSDAFLYFAHEHAIFAADLVSGATSKVAGSSEPGNRLGDAKEARFDSPGGLALADNRLYVSDSGNRRIVRLDLDTGLVSPFVSTLVSSPQGLLLREGPEGENQYLLVADAVLHVVVQIDLFASTPTPGVLLGEYGEPGHNTVRLNQPHSLALVGNTVFVSETGNHVVRSADLTGTPPLRLHPEWGSGQAGFSEGSGTEAELDSPTGMVAVGGVLFVTDTGNSVVRRGVPGSSLELVVGSLGQAGQRQGAGLESSFLRPQGLAGTPSYLWVADGPLVRRVRLQGEGL